MHTDHRGIQRREKLEKTSRRIVVAFVSIAQPLQSRDAGNTHNTDTTHHTPLNFEKKPPAYISTSCLDPPPACIRDQAKLS